MEIYGNALYSDDLSKPRYRVDLSGYMSLCDGNYHQLLALWPGLSHALENQTRYLQIRHSKSAGKASRDYTDKVLVSIRVTESFRYTQTLEIQLIRQQPVWPSRFPNLDPVMQVRVYHDAMTAEPVSYQGHRRVPVKNSIPNKQMYHQDEKYQINEFLSAWLDLCLQSGVEMTQQDPLCT